MSTFQRICFRVRVTSNVDEYFAHRNENVINLSVCLHLTANNSRPSGQLAIRSKLFTVFYSPMCTSLNIQWLPSGWSLELNIDNKSIKSNSPKILRVSSPCSSYWHHVGYIHRITMRFIQCGWNTKHEKFLQSRVRTSALRTITIKFSSHFSQTFPKFPIAFLNLFLIFLEKFPHIYFQFSHRIT